MDNQPNREIVAFIFKTERVTADILKGAMRVAKIIGAHGKQSVNSLASHGEKLQNIEITENNIKSFERTARKYHLDYALKRDKSDSPPTYFVFFKGSSIDVMEKAFADYSKAITKDKRKSVHKTIQKNLSQNINRERTKERSRDREVAI